MAQTKETPTQEKKTPSEGPSKGNSKTSNEKQAEEAEKIEEIGIIEEEPTK